MNPVSQGSPSHSCLPTCHNGSCYSRDRHIAARFIVRSNCDVVDLSTAHVVQCTIGVAGSARDYKSLVCFTNDCVVYSSTGQIPLHLTNRQAVLSGDVIRDARL